MIKYVTVDVQLGSLSWQALHFLHRVGKLKEVLIFNDYWQSLSLRYGSVDVCNCESVSTFPKDTIPSHNTVEY